MVRTINSRDKGKRGELELTHILEDLTGLHCRRGQQYCGASGDADVIGLPGLHIECKRVEKLNVQKAYEQSRCDAKPGEVPVVMHRKNADAWKVTLSLEDFIWLYKQSINYTDEMEKAL